MEKDTHKREIGKCIWLITYAACSPNLEYQMFHAVGLVCDECYTITWRESKYTLIHLKRSKHARLSKMKNAVVELELKYSIKGSCIMGYETLCSNNKEICVTEHPGFRRMVELLNAKSTELNSWLQEGDVFTNKKGLLWKHIEETDPTLMTRAQLLDRIRKLTPLASEALRVKVENENLTSVLEIRSSELEDANKRIDFLTSRNENLFTRLLEKSEECAGFKQRLFEHGIDNTWSKRARADGGI